VQKKGKKELPDMAKQFYIDRAIEEAVFILERINERWPT
jgi:hypothetical protein